MAVGSIDAQTEWSTALAGCNTLIHLAAYQPDGKGGIAQLKVCRRVNVQATVNLARQAAQAGVKRFVFVSSVKVNGETSLEGRPFTEQDIPAPVEPYGVSKWEAEQRLLEIAAATLMELVIVRSPLVYGCGVRGNMQSLERMVRLGLPLPLGGIRNQRSMVSLTNLVDFLLLCCIHPGAAHETFLASDGMDVSVPVLLARMGVIIGIPTKLLPAPVWMLEMAATSLGQRNLFDKLCGNLQVDATKARIQLGWTPSQTLDEGLRQMLGSDPR